MVFNGTSRFPALFAEEAILHIHSPFCQPNESSGFDRRCFLTLYLHTIEGYKLVSDSVTTSPLCKQQAGTLPDSDEGAAIPSPQSKRQLQSACLRARDLCVWGVRSTVALPESERADDRGFPSPLSNWGCSPAFSCSAQQKHRLALRKHFAPHHPARDAPRAPPPLHLFPVASNAMREVVNNYEMLVHIIVHWLVKRYIF